MSSLLPKNNQGCPFLLLAPMEGVGDLPFRRAMAAIEGFDQACTEFIRVPAQGHVKSLAKKYCAHDTFPISQAVQIMGSNCERMAEMAKELELRGAPRIDLNCGCPSNTVTGRGAGSSLLKNPDDVYRVAKSIVDAVTIPVSIKMRSGFEDTSLFKENLLAAQESGVCFITLHPRTKLEGYKPPANWQLIADAKQLLSIPVVGNGDILTVADALRMLEQTSCDALMIGRGSVINPFIFHEIKGYFSGIPFKKTWELMILFVETFVKEMTVQMETKGQISKLKQLMSFLFQGTISLKAVRQQILVIQPESVTDYLEFALPLYKTAWLQHE